MSDYENTDSILRYDTETRPNAVLGDAPTQDIATIEKAAESLTRLRDMENAIALWALALRLRAEVNHES